MDSEKGRGIENLIKEGERKTKERDLLDKNERLEAKNETETSEEERRLEIFSDAIGDSEYYIGGGVGIELIEGAIKHKHGDIDIIIFEDDVESIKGKLQSKGFAITSGHGWGGHNLDAKNFEVTEDDDGFSDKEAVHIGIFVYKRDLARGIARQFLPDGSVGKEFPLEYFNRDKQTLSYKENNFTVADIRLIVSLKLISERPKDIKDIERAKSLLKSKYSAQEIEKLKDVCMQNLKTRNVAGLKRMFDVFLEKGEEITGGNIRDSFIQEIEKEKKGEVDEKYMEAILTFMEKLKDFSATSKENAKQEFVQFIESNMDMILSAQSKLVDETLE